MGLFQVNRTTCAHPDAVEHAFDGFILVVENIGGVRAYGIRLTHRALNQVGILFGEKVRIFALGTPLVLHCNCKIDLRVQ